MLCGSSRLHTRHRHDSSRMAADPRYQYHRLFSLRSSCSPADDQARHWWQYRITASISAHRVNFPQPQVAYNVSKAALLTLDSVAAEWARYGIRVNSISPGYVDTILNEGDGIAEGRPIRRVETLLVAWGSRVS